MLNILYFAKLRDDIGLGQESIDWHPDVDTIAKLVAQLQQRGHPWQQAFGHTTVCSRNQTVVSADEPIEDGDEIAFFPPVTGG